MKLSLDPLSLMELEPSLSNLHLLQSEVRSALSEQSVAACGLLYSVFACGLGAHARSGTVYRYNAEDLLRTFEDELAVHPRGEALIPLRVDLVTQFLLSYPTSKFAMEDHRKLIALVKEYHQSLDDFRLHRAFSELLNSEYRLSKSSPFQAAEAVLRATGMSQLPVTVVGELCQLCYWERCFDDLYRASNLLGAQARNGGDRSDALLGKLLALQQKNDEQEAERVFRELETMEPARSVLWSFRVLEPLVAWSESLWGTQHFPRFVERVNANRSIPPVP